MNRFTLSLKKLRGALLCPHIDFEVILLFPLALSADCGKMDYAGDRKLSKYSVEYACIIKITLYKTGPFPFGSLAASSLLAF